MKKRKGNAGLQQTVSELELLAAASQLGAYLLTQGLVDNVYIIAPANLNKPTSEPWPPTTTAQ